MSNPFFSRSAAFQEGGRVAGSAPTQTPNGYPTMPGYQAGQYGQQPNQYGQEATGYGQQYGQYGQYGQSANQYGQTAGYGQVSPEQMAGLEAQYQAPSATNADHAPYDLRRRHHPHRRHVRHHPGHGCHLLEPGDQHR